MADARTPEHGLTHFTVSDAVAAEYVAVHPTTFHLHEHPERGA